MTFKYNWNSCYICHCFSFNNRKQNYKILIYCSLFLPWLVSWGVASCACHPSCPSGKSGRLNHDSFHTWKFLKSGQESEFAYHSSVTHWPASYLPKLTEGKDEWENGERHQISIVFLLTSSYLASQRGALFDSQVWEKFDIVYIVQFCMTQAFERSVHINLAYYQIESSNSFSGFPSSSKWKSIVMLASESWAEAKFVTERVGIPRALNTEKETLVCRRKICEWLLLPT